MRDSCWYAAEPEEQRSINTPQIQKERNRKMNDRYDMKEQMKEIFETKGGKSFFHELNAAGIPFFFIAATENTEDKTDYFCETITPGAMGIRLTDDKFADHLNIQHQGFVTVLKFPSPAPEVKEQDFSEETGTSTNSVPPAGKESVTGERGEVTASELLDAAIKNIILEQESVQEQPEDDMPTWNPGSEQYSEEISIVWGTKPLEPIKGSGQDRNTRN